MALTRKIEAMKMKVRQTMMILNQFYKINIFFGKDNKIALTRAHFIKNIKTNFFLQL